MKEECSFPIGVCKRMRKSMYVNGNRLIGSTGQRMPRLLSASVVTIYFRHGYGGSMKVSAP